MGFPGTLSGGESIFFEGKHQLGSQESWEKATQLSHQHPLSLPRRLHSTQAAYSSTGVSSAGWGEGSPEGGAIALPQADVVLTGAFHPKRRHLQ